MDSVLTDVIRTRIGIYASLENLTKIPRPANAFMLYRSWAWQKRLDSPDADRNNRVLSQQTGAHWHTLPPHRKLEFELAAKIVKEAHCKLFPGYTYRPNSGSGRSSPTVVRTSRVHPGSSRASSQTDESSPRLQSERRVYDLDEISSGVPESAHEASSSSPSPQSSPSSLSQSPLPSCGSDVKTEEITDDSSERLSEQGGMLDTPQSTHEELCVSMQEMVLDQSPYMSPSMDPNELTPYLAFMSPQYPEDGNITLTQAALGSFSANMLYSSESAFSPLLPSTPEQESSTILLQPTHDTPAQAAPLDLEIRSFPNGENENYSFGFPIADEVDYGSWLADDVIAQ